MNKLETEKATTVIARRMAKENGYPEAMWQLFLQEAYDEYFKLPKGKQRRRRKSESDRN